jgi:hypothetical protein
VAGAGPPAPLVAWAPGPLRPGAQGCHELGSWATLGLRPLLTLQPTLLTLQVLLEPRGLKLEESVFQHLVGALLRLQHQDQLHHLAMHHIVGAPSKLPSPCFHQPRR